MTYTIKQRIRDNAKRIGVEIKLSKNPKKKIDVFNKEGKKLASIGDINYSDYAHYIDDKGLVFANVRKKIYGIHHINDMNVKNSPGYYSKQLLWT
jgi:hypothetical protein